eukprot:6195262-Pleurochrysis_carterae.AAC.1
MGQSEKRVWYGIAHARDAREGRDRGRHGSPAAPRLARIGMAPARSRSQRWAAPPSAAYSTLLRSPRLLACL